MNNLKQTNDVLVISNLCL